MFKISLRLLLLAVAAASVLCNPSSRQLSDCLNLHGVCNFTMFSDDPSYTSLLNFSIQNLRFAGPTNPKPAAILLPKSAGQLAKSVACIRKGPWEIRVRCGGQSYEGTAFVARDGAPFVIIDMMNLNRVRVDLASETAWVEGGATLGETYYAIAQSSALHGFSAGTCLTVGIGGHISCGGFGMLSRKYGVAADNVVDARLVAADGQVLDRKSMGEDVFWAIRGGGGGIWGIVYAWKIKLLKVPETITSCAVSRPGTQKHVAELVGKWQLVAPKFQWDLYLSCILGSRRKPSSSVSASFDIFFLGPKAKAVPILSLKFPELGLQDKDCHETSWIESVVFFSGLDGGATPADLRNRYSHGKGFFKAKSDYVRAVISPQGIETALENLEKEPKGHVIMDPYGGVMDNISSEAIAFPHRRGNLFSIQYLVEWQEEEEEDWRSKEFIEWIGGFYSAMSRYVSSGPRAAYVNYLDFDLGVMRWNVSTVEVTVKHAVEVASLWGKKYFLRNYEPLVRAKTQMDPKNVFPHEQGIPPLCSSK